MTQMLFGKSVTLSNNVPARGITMILAAAAVFVCTLGAPVRSVAADQDAKPIFAWSNIHGSNAVTGPVESVTIYYDPYKYTRPAISIDSKPLPEADISRLVGALTDALGVTIKLPAGPVRLANPPSPQPFTPAILAIATPEPPCASQCKFGTVEDYVGVLADQIRAINFAYNTDASIFTVLAQNLKGTIQDNDNTLASLNQGNVFDGLAAAPLNAQREGDQKSDAARLFLATVHKSQIAAFCYASYMSLEEAKALRTKLPIQEKTTPASCANLEPPLESTFKAFDSKAWASIENVDAHIEKLKRRLYETGLSQKSTLTAKQMDAALAQVKALSVSDFLPGGPKYEMYQKNKDQVTSLIHALAAPNNVSDFRLTVPISCGTGGQQMAISAAAVDRTQSDPSKLTVVPQIVTVSCYPRSYLALGGGISYIADANYNVVQTNYLTNNGGAPPLAPPSFQTVNTLVQRPNNYRIAGYAMVHRCFCIHPGDKWEKYTSLGFGFSNQNPQLTAGLTMGYARSTFLTLAGVLGYRTVLNGGNAAGTLVPSGYTVSTSKGVQGGFGLIFSFPVPVSVGH